MHSITLKNQANKKLPVLFLLILGAIIAIQIGSAIASGQTLILILVIFLVLAIIAWVNSQLGVVLIITLTFFQDWLIYGLNVLPNNFALLSEGLIVALSIKVIPNLIRTKSWQKTSIDNIMLLFVLLNLMSAIINDLTFLEIVLGIRLYFRYILLYYIIVNSNLDEVYLRKLVYVYIGTAIVSVPILFINLSIFGPTDYAGGGIGLKSSASLLFNLTIIILLFSWMIKKGMKLRWLVLAGGLMLVWVFGSVVAAFFYLPLVLLFISRRLTNLRYFYVLPFIFVIYGMAVSYYPRVFANNYLHKFLFSPTAAVDYIKGTPQRGGDYGEAGLRRLPAIFFAHNLVRKNLFSLTFGLGLGVTSDTGSKLSSTSNIYRRYERENLSGRQLPQFIAEVGYLGLLLIFIMLYKLGTVNNKLLGTKLDEFWSGVCVAFEGAIFLFIVMMPYRTTWTANVSGLFFWSLAAIVIKKWSFVNRSIPARQESLSLR